MPLHIDKDKAKQTIELILDNVRTEADTGLLDEYYRLYKKEVSLFNRSKAAAYLLMLYDRQSGGIRKNIRRTVQEKNSKDDTRYPLSDEESKWLFFGAGRSRRVFPREILGLINTKTAIPKEDIGAIRILDNYSFVQVRDTIADKIIDALNGITFRGRLLTVNFAKSRNDEEDEDDTDEFTAEQEPF